MKLFWIREIEDTMAHGFGLPLYYVDTSDQPYALMGCNDEDGEHDLSRRIQVHYSNPHNLPLIRTPSTVLQNAHPIIESATGQLLLGWRDYSIYDPRCLLVVSGVEPVPIMASVALPMRSPCRNFPQAHTGLAIRQPVMLCSAEDSATGKAHSLWLFNSSQRLLLADHVVLFRQDTIQVLKLDDSSTLETTFGRYTQEIWL